LEGTADGVEPGCWLGDVDGAALGVADGAALGCTLGAADGFALGCWLGSGREELQCRVKGIEISSPKSSS